MRVLAYLKYLFTPAVDVELYQGQDVDFSTRLVFPEDHSAQEDLVQIIDILATIRSVLSSEVFQDLLLQQPRKKKRSKNKINVFALDEGLLEKCFVFHSREVAKYRHVGYAPLGIPIFGQVEDKLFTLYVDSEEVPQFIHIKFGTFVYFEEESHGSRKKKSGRSSRGSSRQQAERRS